MMMCQWKSFALCSKSWGFPVETDEIVDWLRSDFSQSGVPVYTDEEICTFVSKPDESDDDDDDGDYDGDNNDLTTDTCPIYHGAEARMFELCLTWLEHQPEASVHNTTILRELHVLAAKKDFHSAVSLSMDRHRL